MTKKTPVHMIPHLAILQAVESSIMATSRQLTGWAISSAFNNNNSYNNRNNTAGEVRISPQNCHIPSVITRERLCHDKIVTLNPSPTNDAVF